MKLKQKRLKKPDCRKGKKKSVSEVKYKGSYTEFILLIRILIKKTFLNEWTVLLINEYPSLYSSLC